MTESLTAEPEITEELIAAHGLKPDEYQRILDLIGRVPTLTELGIFSAMWNEHCSYKSSKKWLRTLPTSGPQVICGPGENAGIVDIGDGHALVFKMESHNHPSYIEPYQGAATGVDQHRPLWKVAECRRIQQVFCVVGERQEQDEDLRIPERRLQPVLAGQAAYSRHILGRTAPAGTRTCCGCGAHPWQPHEPLRGRGSAG